jgi:hypothetical protein
MDTCFAMHALLSDDHSLPPSKPNTSVNLTLASTDLERASLIKWFLIFCLAAMLSFIVC